MRTSALFFEKNFGYLEIYGVSAQTREKEDEPVRTRGEGSQFFAILCGSHQWTDQNTQFFTVSTNVRNFAVLPIGNLVFGLVFAF